MAPDYSGCAAGRRAGKRIVGTSPGGIDAARAVWPELPTMRALDRFEKWYLSHLVDRRSRTSR